MIKENYAVAGDCNRVVFNKLTKATLFVADVESKYILYFSMTWANSLVFFSGCLCLLYAITDLLNPRRRLATQLQAGFTFCIAIIFLHNFFQEAHLLSRFPILFSWTLPAVIFFAPLFYHFLIQSLQLEEFKKKRLILELMPGLLVLALTILVHPEFFNILDRPADAVKRNVAQNRLFVILSAFYVFCYGTYFIFRVAKALTLKNIRQESSIQIFIGFAVSVLLGASFTLFVWFSENAMLLTYQFIPQALLIICWHIIRVNYPYFFDDLQIIVHREKYKKSQLSQINVDEIENQLKHLMQTDYAYRDESLSLGGLATMLGISRHQLSEFFNGHLKKTFNVYVNGHRVNEAARLLVEEPEETVLSIAFRVGFASKSTFNKVFANEIGTSPTQFRSKRT